VFYLDILTLYGVGEPAVHRAAEVSNLPYKQLLNIRSYYETTYS